MAETLRRHWPEYAVEALFLAVFLLTAGLASSWMQGAAGGALAGVVTGLVLMGLVYSPWGRRSGSHLNPAITLAYLRLGKIRRWDALCYLVAQVGAGLAAVWLLRSGLLSPAATPPSLLSTSLGPTGVWAAFVTELVLSASAMLLILVTSNHARWFRWTGLLYGLLVMLIVACAAPLSGFGMNVARLLAVDLSAAGGSVWINLLPPLLGMQLAVEAYRLFTRRSQVLCAKLAHNTHGHCIFRCQHPYQTRARAMAAIQRRAAARRKASASLTDR